jgi:hypothetical protein
VSGEDFHVDPAALREAARKLQGHADEVERLGRKLSGSTDGRVGHGPIGELAENLVKRGLRGVCHGVTQAVSEFHRGTAEGLEAAARRTEAVDGEAAQGFQRSGHPAHLLVDGWSPVLKTENLSAGGGPPADKAAVFAAAGGRLRRVSGPDTWRTLDETRRQRVTETMHVVLLEEYGLPGGMPAWRDLGSGTYGQYSPITDRISYNYQVLPKDNSPEESVKTIAHEARHQYQFGVMKGTLPEPEAGIAATWSQALSDYPKGDPDQWTLAERQQYWNNPLERDARAAEDAVYRKYSEG